MNEELNVVTADEGTETSTTTQPPAGRRAGYVVAIIINAIGLYFVQNLLEWDVSFVTSEFAEVDGVISLSLIATIVVNAFFLFYDARWFKGLGEGLSQTISLIATIRLLQVFPFDFDEWDGPWDQVARAVLILAVIGTIISILASLRNVILGLGELGTSP
jgi:hypothetical protein